MLKIFYGEPIEKLIWSPSKYFDFNFEPEWLQADIVKNMVKDVDNSDILSPYCIQSPVLGQIPPQMLSGGVKALILAFNESDLYLNGSASGDNCAKWWLELGKLKDITINLGHNMDFGHDPFEILILNNNKIAHTKEDIWDAIAEYL